METASLNIERIRWQQAVLAPQLDRSLLIGLTDPPWPLQDVRLRVHRNHAFEFVQSPATVFLNYAGLRPQWTLSDYDDSLSFASVSRDRPVDVEILWLDFVRYGLAADELTAWLADRLTALRAESAAPIIVTGPLPSDPIAAATLVPINAMPGVYVADPAAAFDALGAAFLDPARAEFQGTRFSRVAQLELAREFGLKWVPPVVAPRIKAIAIDLDNTLYRGVLGEDGPSGIEITAGHRLLQETLADLGAQGVLLAFLSKNEQRDVDRMFAERGDFVLKPDNIAGMRVNWSGKGENIASLAAEFNISPTAFLLLDDNPGELWACAEAIPGLAILHANEDAALTATHLSRFPGLFAFSTDSTDAIRAADIRAAQQRRRVQADAPQDPAAYLRAMGTQIRLRARPRDLYQRLCDIPRKTNQFNLALQRLRETDVAAYIEAPDRCVVSFDLADRISDSGNVGAVYVRRDGETLVVDELCVSCRALGRSVEDIMIADAIAFAGKQIGAACTQLRFTYRNGPRNQPALGWLAKIAGGSLEGVTEEGAEDESLREIILPLSVLENEQRDKLADAVTITRLVG